MKPRLFPLVLPIALIATFAYAFPCPSAQDAIKEYVQVVNAEIIVRVSDRGKPVSKLKKSDFQLTVNGQALAINGFSEFRRTMAPVLDGEASGPAAAAVPLPPAPRLFILYFWLFEPCPDYLQALDYFFRAVYLPCDRVLLVSPRRVYEIGRPEETASQRQALDADLTDFHKRVAAARRRIRLDMRTDAARDFDRHNQAPIIAGSQTPLDVNIEQFREFAASLQKVDIEKWVLVFCQRDLALFSDTAFVGSMHSDIPNAPAISNPYYEREPRNQGQQPSAFFGFIISQISGHKPLVKFKKAEMEKMFIQGGATFHLLVLDSPNRESVLSEQAHFEEVQTGWQDVFTAISTATGGSVLQDNSMTGALQRFSRQQDIYYILTYEPPAAIPSGQKIKLELPGKSYDLFYNDKGVKRTGKFAIHDIRWQEPVLTLTAENYLLDWQPHGVAGHMALTIFATPEQEEEMTFACELWLPERKPQIQVKLQFPKKGRYHLLMEAVDLLGQGTASAEMDISWEGVPVPAGKAEMEVEEILPVDRDSQL